MSVKTSVERKSHTMGKTKKIVPAVQARLMILRMEMPELL